MWLSAIMVGKKMPNRPPFDGRLIVTAPRQAIVGINKKAVDKQSTSSQQAASHPSDVGVTPLVPLIVTQIHGFEKHWKSFPFMCHSPHELKTSFSPPRGSMMTAHPGLSGKPMLVPSHCNPNPLEKH